MKLEPVAWRYAYKGGKWTVQKNMPGWYRPEMADVDLEPLVTLTSAQSALDAKDARIAELERERNQLLDENCDLRNEPWPAWATAVLKVIRSHTGYDGYDDATEGVDMPLELSEHLSEMEDEADRWKARATAAEALLKEVEKVLEPLAALTMVDRVQRLCLGEDIDHWSADSFGVTLGHLRAARSLCERIKGDRG